MFMAFNEPPSRDSVTRHASVPGSLKNRVDSVGDLRPGLGSLAP
jgi:hypothetical protein